MLKQKILEQIVGSFEKWYNEQQELQLACKKGCSTCCTQSVTITAIEGEKILRHIIAEDKSQWLAAKLSTNRKHKPPQFTTNEFAQACLEERDLGPLDQNSSYTCPFLDDNVCSIYTVRPFSCRLFISSVTCDKDKAAQVPDYYLEATTAVNQLIEHLGQKEYWGNMLDVLPALLDIIEFREIAKHVPQTLPIQARMQTITARPLPGFLLSEEGASRVTPLLENIFQTEIEGKSIEDILNGR